MINLYGHRDGETKEFDLVTNEGKRINFIDGKYIAEDAKVSNELKRTVLAESPIWDEREKCFHWIDICFNKFYSLWLNEDDLAASKVRELPFSPLREGKEPPRVSVMTPAEHGGFICSFTREVRLWSPEDYRRWRE